MHAHNFSLFHPGPSLYSTSCFVFGSPSTSFRIPFDECMLRNRRKYCWRLKTNWWPSLGCGCFWTDKVHRLGVCSWCSGKMQLLCERLWSKSWGYISNLFTNYVKKQIFRNDEISLLWFEMKGKENFCVINLLSFRNLGKVLYQTAKKSFFLSFYSEWSLLSCKERCKLIKYFANKPGKFGFKFWLAVDVENRSLLKGFPYVGKDEMQSLDVSMPADVVLKLLGSSFFTKLQCHMW